MPRSIPVFYGSVRSDRQGIKAARFLQSRLEQRGFDAPLVDPVEYPLPLLDRMYKEYEEGEAPELLEELASLIRNADGFLVVSGEYNHSIPPALTNLMDHFLEEYRFRPSAIACYSAGAFGGVRAAMQLRAFLAELGAASIPSILPIPKVQDQFEEDGTPKDAAWDRRVRRFLDEFTWYVEALAAQREQGTPY